MSEQKRKVGRPCIGNGPQNKRCTFKFTKEEYDRFDAIVKNRGISRTKFVRKIISEAFEMDNKKKS